MPFNGAGTYSRISPAYSGTTVWQQEETGGFGRVATRHDVHDQDVADALTNCLTKDGQSTVSANLTIGGNNITNLGYATSRNSAVPVGQHVDGFPLFGGTSSGAANVYALTVTPAPTAYVQGMEVWFFAHQTNTASDVFLSIGSLPQIRVQSRRTGTSAGNLRVAEIPSGSIVHCVFTSDSGGVFTLLSEEFQSWASWTPEIFLDGGGSVSSPTILVGRYLTKDNLCFWNLSFTCVLSISGAPLLYVGARLPAGVPSVSKDQFGVGASTGDAGRLGICLQITNQNGMFWGPKADFASVWSPAASGGHIFAGQGVYEIA